MLYQQLMTKDHDAAVSGSSGVNKATKMLDMTSQLDTLMCANVS